MQRRGADQLALFGCAGRPSVTEAADNRAYNLRSRRVGLAFVKQFVATLLALLVMSPGLCDGNKPTSPVLGTPRGSIRSNLTSLSA
jgi:hypothetical protein